MTRARLAVNVTITVLGTLLIAAIGYGGMAASQVQRTAAVQSPPPASPSPKPNPIVLPPPSIELPPPSAAPSALVAIDADMISGSMGWMLLSNCPLQPAVECHYATARTEKGGWQWTSPVQVGPEFAPAGGGDALTAIRFLNQDDGFVYGSSGIYITHDGGAVWQKSDLPGFSSTVAISPATVWETDYPCTKGTLCQYEIRSSADGGRTWSDPHRLPLNFSPETVVAFAHGVAMSSVPTGEIVMTSDGGHSWQSIKSPCAANAFRGRVATFDGSELWELCLGYPDGTGAFTDRSLFVSTDGGKTWSARVAKQTAASVLSWLVSNSLQTAVASGDWATFITHDGGKSWAQASPAYVNVSRIFRLTPTYGIAMDIGRELVETLDGGANWNDVGALPSRLS